MNSISSTYVIAAILVIISLPIILVGGIIGIYREFQYIRQARASGERITFYTQPKLLASAASALFALTIILSGVLFVCINYRLLSQSLEWVVIGLVALAGVFGILYLTQVLRG